MTDARHRKLSRLLRALAVCVALVPTVATASTVTHFVIYFAPGAATLDKRGERDAQEFAQILKRQSRLRLLEVAGHCGKDEAKTRRLAKDLSQKRADVVRNRLIALGIKPSRLVSKAYGFSKPIGADTPEGRARNRRVNLRILDIGPDTSDPPEPPKKKRRRRRDE